MRNRLDIESAIIEMKDLTVLTKFIRNNAETIDNKEDYESLISIVDEVLRRKGEKLYSAFYQGSLI